MPVRASPRRSVGAIPGASAANTTAGRSLPRRPGVLPRFAAFPVLSAALAQLVLLAATANLYGYHRDELYFRMLPPATGYVDQPPLTPTLARFFTDVVADEVWAIRIPAMLFA